MWILTCVPSLTLLIHPPTIHVSKPNTSCLHLVVSLSLWWWKPVAVCGTLLLNIITKKEAPSDLGDSLRMAFFSSVLCITCGCPRQPVTPWMVPDAPVLANEAKLLSGQLSLSLALTGCINLGFNPGVESHPLFTFCSCSQPVLPEPGISSDSSCTAQARIELQAHTHWQGHRRRNNLDTGLRFGKTYGLSGRSRPLF